MVCVFYIFISFMFCRKVEWKLKLTFRASPFAEQTVSVMTKETDAISRRLVPSFEQRKCKLESIPVYTSARFKFDMLGVKKHYILVIN